jgi:hypothetical protein
VAKPTGAVNRARSKGAPVYCGKACSGLARRIERTKSEKVAIKAAYDAEYRAKNRGMLKSKKHAHYKATYDPAEAAEKRKARMPYHVEYCRRPEYREWKAQYDQKYRAGKWFGDFGEAAIILNQLEAEIATRASRTDIYRANGILNKHQTRRRDYERQTQRR